MHELRHTNISILLDRGASMKEVQEEVRKAAMHRFENFAAQKLPDMPLFKQVGMQMVLFGAKEPKRKHRK